MQNLRVSFQTLGCRLNIFESDGLSNALKNVGIKTVSMEENPEIVIVNTCTVTNKADSKNRNIIRSAIKNNPGSQVWVTGCYAETDKSIIENIPGVTGVVGNTEKSNLPNLILEKFNIPFSPPKNLDRFSYSDVLPVNHTRAYLKIQDGCNRVCSYCKIPSARGKGVSRKKDDILDQVKFLQDNGIGEIILTGVNLGWYRDENGDKAFNSLLEEILNLLEYSRIRLSSIEPSDVNATLSKLISHPRFCKYLHVPLQSGNSEILRKMKRSYTAETFRKRIEIVLSDHPNIFIGTDIIAGFPGETLEQFNDSLQLVKDLSISKVHAFPYSPRKGTAAEILMDSLSKEDKRKRVFELNSLSEKMYYEYYKKNENKIFEGILESSNQVLTDNYLKVSLKEDSLLANLKIGQFISVKPIAFNTTEKNNPIIGELAKL
ncbi:MAG: tRNA (N(6)-L-threonylcarbamoyladenosine(37)-C(2))-methylthiotransferase MtaB [Spirochaetia bacterium]|nr:tRNA (N(6)-L-threonylcarbamoyladenosine(37)-C(2))-methylthiotransferase MtaB [Spirochaetia bacterium]